jgi:tetratricopeptide (TPR) repeat protein
MITIRKRAARIGGNGGGQRIFRSVFHAACVQWALLLVLWASALAHSADVSSNFEEANKLYEEGKFSEAAAAYEKIVRGGLASPELYFNLGNAQFKSGRIGRAILNYRLAEQLAPRDPDVRANLRFARNSVGGTTGVPAGWRRAISRLNLNEWTILTAGALWLWFTLLTLGQWRPTLKKSLGGYTGTAGAAGALLAVCLGAACYERYAVTSAVVTAHEAVVRYGPLDESQSYFTARDGTELTVLDKKGDWLQVTDRAKRIGWVRRAQVVTMRDMSNATTATAARAQRS